MLQGKTAVLARYIELQKHNSVGEGGGVDNNWEGRLGNSSILFLFLQINWEIGN